MHPQEQLGKGLQIVEYTDSFVGRELSFDAGFRATCSKSNRTLQCGGRLTGVLGMEKFFVIMPSLP